MVPFGRKIASYYGSLKIPDRLGIGFESSDISQSRAYSEPALTETTTTLSSIAKKCEKYASKTEENSSKFW